MIGDGNEVYSKRSAYSRIKKEMKRNDDKLIYKY